MKVKMKIWISGTRNGEAWPAPGVEIDLPDGEAAKLCANGSALPVRSDEDDVETRVESKPKAAAKKAAAEKRG